MVIWYLVAAALSLIDTISASDAREPVRVPVRIRRDRPKR
jgi:hypothetical protein